MCAVGRFETSRRIVAAAQPPPIADLWPGGPHFRVGPSRLMQCGKKDGGPVPWHADKISGGYVVRDANGQALAHIYSRENEAEARQAKVLTKDEARRIAINIARLPELLGKGERD
jgi:hypothetical protein